MKKTLKIYMVKGRPGGSIIRDRINAILDKIGTSYGYEIYKIYQELFGRVHIRSIYYNLKKGIENEEIILVNVKREIGNYSWGDEVEKIYYAKGPYANPILNKKDQEKIKQIKTKNTGKIEWEKELETIYSDLKKEIREFKKRKLYSQTRKKFEKHYQEKINKFSRFSQQKISLNNIKKYETELKKELSI
jgi:hypothetical protein